MGEVQEFMEDITPKNQKMEMPRIKLFHDTIIENTEAEVDIIPTEADLEFLLINSCKIDAIKVQTIVEGFIRGKNTLVYSV